jgi:hypothetical protein
MTGFSRALAFRTSKPVNVSVEPVRHAESRGPRPAVPYGLPKIDDYSDEQLIALCW